MVPDDVAGGDEQILPPVQIHVEERRAPADVFLAHFGEASLHSIVLKAHHAGSDIVAIQTMQLVFVVGDPQRGTARLVEIAGVHTHTAVGVALVIQGRATDLRDFLETDLSGRRDVEVEKFGRGVVGHVQVWLAIAIHINHHHAQTLVAIRAGRDKARRRADIHERSPPGVVIQLVRQALEIFGWANVGRFAIVVTARVVGE